MLLDPRHDIEVSRRPTSPARASPARDPNLHAVPRPGRYPDLDLPAPAHPAATPAHLARLLDDPALTPTPQARRREREKPLVTVLYPPATTLGTRQRRSPRSRPRPPALATRLLDGHPDPRRDTVQRIFETQPDVYGYILAFCPGPLGGVGRTSEDVPEVSEAAEHVLDVLEVRAPWLPLSCSLRAEEVAGAFIVFPSFLGIREDLVGVLYLLETLFGLLVAGVGVGMKLARQPAVGAPDLILRGLFGYLESFVEIHLLHTLSLLRNYNFRWPDRLPVE